jgi:hypothetical protein
VNGTDIQFGGILSEYNVIHFLEYTHSPSNIRQDFQPSVHQVQGVLIKCLLFDEYSKVMYSLIIVVHAFSPLYPHQITIPANCTDRMIGAFRRSQCQLLRIEGVAKSAQRMPMAIFSYFYTGTATFSSK